MMLGFVYIWRDRKVNLHQVKVRFGNLWYYLLIHYYGTHLEDILKNGRIVENKCSRIERWKELEEPDYKDYCDLSQYELSRIIFLKAPEEERTERDTEWAGLESYYRRNFLKEIDLTIRWYPNKFTVFFSPPSNIVLNFWKRLPRRKNKKKPKNIIRWFNMATDVEDKINYTVPLCLGTYRVELSALIWWLGEVDRETLLLEMFI